MKVWKPVKKPIFSSCRSRCSLEKVCHVFSYIDMMKSFWWSICAIVLLCLAHGESYTEGDPTYKPKRNVEEVVVEVLDTYIWNLSEIIQGNMSYPSESTVIAMLLLFILFQFSLFALGSHLRSSVLNGSVTKLTRYLIINVMIYLIEVPLLVVLVYLLGMPTVGYFVYLLCNFSYEVSVLIIVREYRDQLVGEDPPLDLLRCNFYYLHGIL